MFTKKIVGWNIKYCYRDKSIQNVVFYILSAPFLSEYLTPFGIIALLTECELDFIFRNIWNMEIWDALNPIKPSNIFKNLDIWTF